MIPASDVFTVSKQQVLGSFENDFVLLASLSVFGVSNLIDHTAEISHHMELIEDNLGIRQFFFTALINGSHMSMATASMARRCRGFS